MEAPAKAIWFISLRQIMIDGKLTKPAPESLLPFVLTADTSGIFTKPYFV